MQPVKSHRHTHIYVDKKSKSQTLGKLHFDIYGYLLKPSKCHSYNIIT